MLQPASVDSLYAEYNRLVKALEKKPGPTGKVLLTFGSDESASTTLQRLQAGLEFRRGTYPRELRAETEISTTNKNGEMTRDNRLLVNYDFSFTPTFEVFAFGELYSIPS